MKRSTLLYQKVESLMDDMCNVEIEFRSKPTIKSRKQLLRVHDRLQILSEVIKGLMR